MKKWIKRNKILVAIATMLFVAFVLAVLDTPGAIVIWEIICELAGLAVIVWVAIVLLRIVFPSLFKKKGGE